MVFQPSQFTSPMASPKLQLAAHLQSLDFTLAVFVEKCCESLLVAQWTDMVLAIARSMQDWQKWWPQQLESTGFVITWRHRGHSVSFGGRSRNSISSSSSSHLFRSGSLSTLGGVRTCADTKEGGGLVSFSALLNSILVDQNKQTNKKTPHNGQLETRRERETGTGTGNGNGNGNRKLNA